MAKYCTSCGTELNPSWKACPNCGAILESDQSQTPSESQSSAPAPAPPSYAPTYARTYSAGLGNVFGTIALIFGITGLIFRIFIFGGIFGGIFGIIAIVTGAIGINKDDNTSFATGGLILGLLDVAFFLLFSFDLPGLF